MTNYKFSFHCVDNGGKHQAFTVSAPNKAAAIEKAMKKDSRLARQVNDIVNNINQHKDNQ